ncbi:hypothetical protein VTK73DRAFT_10322 [Phialemonium thermophilum]|uniref:DUF8021 domain-containing protein n=1 Tax=Phialemonium thermophilum TaxID=223376 RepID=A0ABR3XG61_9PEZI
MLGSILVTYLSLAGAGLAAPRAQACDRAFLQSQADAYVTAQVAGSPSGLKAAGASTNYTENFKAADLSKGILATPLKVAHNRSTLDTTECATFTELIVTEGASHVIGTQMRFGADGGLAKMETLVTSTGDWLFNPEGTLRYASQEDWGPIPEAERDSREVIQAAGDAYLDLFNNKSVVVPWGNPCARLEGGSYIQPSCNAGVPSGIRQVNRRYVIDEVVGSVDIMFDFAAADPDSHEFRIEKGKIRYVHTMTVMK